jgi:hypothetical protein
MIKTLFIRSVLVFIYSLSSTVYAVDYEAIATETSDGVTNQSHIFVKNNQVRIEYIANGEPLVQISNPNSKRSWILFPNDKTYIESISTANLLPKSNKVNLKRICAPKNVKCTKERTEVVHARKAVCWRIERFKKNKKIVSHLWVDTQNAFPVKQKYENGSYTELRFVKNEKIEGRKTQKWMLTLVNQFKETINIFQWYDKKLNLTIKELYPDNSVKELKNIKVKKLKNTLFLLPKGYSKRKHDETLAR